MFVVIDFLSFRMPLGTAETTWDTTSPLMSSSDILEKVGHRMTPFEEFKDWCIVTFIVLDELFSVPSA